MKQVKFVRGAPPYVTGDIAVFDDAKADELLANKLAVVYPPLSRGVSKESERVKTSSLDAPPKDKMVKRRETKKK